MGSKILLDINVCLDFLTKRKPFSDAAGQLFQAIEHEKASAVISAISFDTMFYVLRPDLGRQKATDKLNTLTLHISIGTVNSTVVHEALDATWSDLEDALQYYTAVHNNCDILITRNKKDFKNADIQVLSPLEFLDKLNKDEK